jgi:hypothetical protein
MNLFLENVKINLVDKNTYFIFTKYLQNIYEK